MAGACRGDVRKHPTQKGHSMGTTSAVCELWCEEGQGAGFGNVWDDILTLERSTNGSYQLRLERHPKDTYADDDEIEDPSEIYCSRAFRKPERLLNLLMGPPTDAMERYGPWPDFNLRDVIQMLANVVEFDARFAAGALRSLADRVDHR